MSEVKCPKCAALVLEHEFHGCSIAEYGECVNCMIAGQRHVDMHALELIAKQRVANIERPGSVRTFSVTVMTSKAVPDLTDFIGGRVWTLDGVTDVDVKEL